MYIHEIIMACYIFCFAGIAAGLTCGVLSHLHRKTEVNKAVVVFGVHSSFSNAIALASQLKKFLYCETDIYCQLDSCE